MIVVAIYGYARVSTTDQDASVQEQKLLEAGCQLVRTEQKSGTSLSGRTELQTLMQFMREGDVLIVTRIDRLARSVGDLQTIVADLKEKRVALRATEQPVDTSSAAGKAFVDMLAVFAEFETNLRRERQLEGIASAKAKGLYKGRKRSVCRIKVRELHESGMGATAIAQKLCVGRASVYRALAGL